MKLVNLGCGSHYHSDWINIDFKSNSNHVIAHNLYLQLPSVARNADVIYSSHVLEHFSKNFAPLFLKECYRALKPGGIIRIVVPDLEQIIRNYLLFLEGSKKGDIDSQEKYEWSLIELFDQMVRNYSGGEMLEYWKQNPMPQEDFVFSRVGSEARNAIKKIRSNLSTKKTKNNKIKTAEQIGKFRLSGEVHQWMYDEYSLKKLLANSGFKNINKKQANESDILNFNKYLLDIENNGDIRKPDSLFMEACK